MTSHGAKIFPRNLTARAAYRVIGNPDVTRPEDAVGNCYPGLESDNRNLDRRFFPGLVFNFVARTDTDAPWSEPLRYGAQLAYVDSRGDTDLQPAVIAEMDDQTRALAAPLSKALSGAVGSKLSAGTWHIEWIEQFGKRIGLMQVLPEEGIAAGLDGLFVWRLVRGLEPGPVTISLHQRGVDAPSVKLDGWRRIFTDPRTGVISEAYQPGELSQSLCSPWQHDFRDCNCHYWPANRPDVVHLAVEPGASVLPDGRPADSERATLLVDWLRADRDAAVSATVEGVVADNRPYQLDYYQINRAWADFAVVLDNTEIGGVYFPSAAGTAPPYGSPAELAQAVAALAPVEMTLAIEYIYARFSLLSADEAGTSRSDLRDHVVFARHMLMLTAGNEMMHLRYANEILWALADAGLTDNYTPVVVPSLTVPTRPGVTRPRALRPLDQGALADFIASEDPKGTIEADYTRIAATLRDKVYPAHLGELATRIVNGGLDHFIRLREIQAVLRAHGDQDPVYLRKLAPGTPEQTAAALAAYANIASSLRQAYALMANGRFAEAGVGIAASRSAMNTLLAEGESLAAAGIGVPFW